MKNAPRDDRRNDANGKWALIKAKKEIDFSIPPEYDPDDDDDDDDLSTHKHNSQHKNEWMREA